jgi:hypothetical protein
LSSIASGAAVDSRVTLKSSLVNSSFVLPGYFWIVSRSESKPASGLIVTGRRVSSPRSKSAYNDDRFDNNAMSCAVNGSAVEKTT